MVFAATGTPGRFALAGRGTPDLPTPDITDRLVHEVIAGWVESRPDAVALRLVEPARTQVWTYRRLWQRVSRLRQRVFADLPFGSRIVMALAGDADYVAGFVAALASGLVPVPLFLPSTDAPERYLRRARHVLRDCGPAAVYTSADLADALAHGDLLDGLPLRTPDSVAEPARSPSAAAAPDAGRIAFLQYSSGSTGEPKGIVNTHRSMLHQLAIGTALWNRCDDIHTVSWLPLYHDLGIFWGVLLALATGGTATVIPPFDFVTDPRIWLQTVHDVRGNWIAGPDFAYRRCVEAFDEAAIESLDLSCLHLAVNGAEPIRAATLRDFAATFQPAGLAAAAIVPQYGLAEAGLAVSGTLQRRSWVQGDFDATRLNQGRAVRIDDPPPAGRRAQTLVSCGDSTFGWNVRIVDPKRRVVLPDGEVGEVWVGGAGLADGYWRRPDLTAETFAATTADGAGPYLRTGDAGFRYDGELYLCGRYRDLIIVGGNNYFPNDIEFTAEQAPCGIESGGACAVQPDLPTSFDEWWLMVETREVDVVTDVAEDLEDLGRILHRRILRTHQTAPERIIWVRPGTLPRTTSGKIRRRKALRMLQSAQLDVVHEVSASSKQSQPQLAASALAEYVAELLGVRLDALHSNLDLITMGLTSMMTAQLVEWSAQRGRRLDFAALYGAPRLAAWQRLFDAAPTIPAAAPHSVTADEQFRTTALQRAYWVGRNADQPLGGVGCQTYVELRGATIDPDRLDKAVSELTHRHPMLRSAFPDADRCRIAAPHTLEPVRVHDLTFADAAACETHLAAARDRLRTHHFAIEIGDTWRIELTRLPDHCVVHFAVNLIIADVTSLGILLRDLATLYRGDALPAVPPGFTTLMTRSDRPPLTDGAGDAEPLPEGPQLPRTEERDVAFRRLQRRLDCATVAALDATCRTHGITRAAAFLTGYLLVLGHWSGTDDFLVTVTTFDRPPGCQDVVGDFTDSRLVRNDTGASGGFADRARATQQRLRDALNAPDALSLLAEQAQAGTGHSGIVPTVFTYAAGAVAARPRDTDTLGEIAEVTATTPQVLIDNQVGTVPGSAAELIVSWDYRSGCFPPGVVGDMFDAYVELLQRLGTHDWSRPAVIDLPQHTRAVRQRCNDTTRPLPGGLLYDGFRTRAELAPDDIALCWGADEFSTGAHGDPIGRTAAQLTYGELDEYARRVAAALADHHPPRSIIGVQLPKGPTQIVAVLGVLLAGCTYLPIGVDQPRRRCARIHTSSGMTGLIRSTRPETDAAPSVPVVHDIESMLGAAPTGPVRVDPHSTAYVIYTSGSTGEPKGVPVSHTAALNTVVDVNHRNALSDADALLAVSALDFDLSVYDIFGPLSCGARIVVVSERARRDAFRWNTLVAELGVTVWNSAPGLLGMLLIAAGEPGEHGPAALAGLRLVLLSGDWIPLDMPARLHSAAPRARIVAMGGATEAAIWSNEFVLRADGGLAPSRPVDPDWPSIPYGHPLANQMFRVVDAAGRDRPDYVAGELWIGGAGVALGYHNAPQLAAERFVVDETGRRWYRTGDLGRYWRDGTLEFLGRADSQVKIGGHRVECGEVEHILRGHPQVDAALVVPIHRNSALGAVIVWARGRGRGAIAAVTDSEVADLRSYLATRLPQYMIPKSYVAQNQLPLTRNGKIDRRGVVRAVEASVEARGQSYAQASTQAETGRRSLTPVERVVAEVWSEVLDTPITGREHNFFAHGGDSLCATRVVALLRRRGIAGAEVGQLLHRQTLGEFSAICVASEPADHPGSPVGHDVVVQPPADAAFPLTRLQQAYVLGSAGINGTSRAPTYFAIVLESPAVPGDIDTDRFADVVARCVDEFALLRCALDTDTTQRVHTPGRPTDVLVTTEAPPDPDALLRRMAEAVFDPRTVPVIRCFVPATPTRWVGLLVNYLSLDARSLATVITTIIADYQRVPRPRPVDPSAGVFARFTAESRVENPGSTGGENGDDTVSSPPRLPVNLGRLESTNRVTFVRSSFTLDAAGFDRLRDSAARLRVTPTAVIFEAFTAALHAIGAGDSFAVVVPVSHRPDYAPVDREVLGNFTRLALCLADYRITPPGSPEAVLAAQRQLWRSVADGRDATGQLAALRSAGSTGYQVVFTSTLGLTSQGPAELSNIRTLTQTPGVWLDCQVEDDRGGARISWDTAAGVIANEPLTTAFARFERAVRSHAEHSAREQTSPAPPALPARSAVPHTPAPQAQNFGWAGTVITVAAELCHDAPVRPEYGELVSRWRRLDSDAADVPQAAPTAGTRRAARRLADIVTGVTAPQSLIGDPQLAPESMLLAEPLLAAALADLTEQIFDHAHTLRRRLRIVEIGSRTGAVTQRLIEAIDAVVDEYLCFEPNPVLAEIAAGRHAGHRGAPVRRIDSPAEATGVDVVICCGSLHQIAEPAAVLDAITPADGGWLWAAEICQVTPATLASAAILNPALLAPGALPSADEWWRFFTEHGWQPVRMTQDGPGLTLVARRQGTGIGTRVPPSTVTAPPPVRRTPTRTAGLPDEATLETIAAIWARHLNAPAPTADDDFFLLGGDSLAATRVFTDLQAAGFTRLALVDLFNRPVLGELAAHAGTPTAVAPQPASPEPADTAGLEDQIEFPLTAIQQAYLAGRLGGFLLSGVGAHCYFEFEVPEFNRSRFEAAARQLISRHPGLRTTVAVATENDPTPGRHARVHPTPIEPVLREYSDVRAAMRDQVIDVTSRPGIEFGLQRDPDAPENDRCTIGISMDNIMLDGTSMMIALAQLNFLYRGGAVDELPASKTSFARYVRTHPELQPDADEAALPHLATSRNYWRARLASLPPAPELVSMRTLLDIDKPVFDRVEALIDKDSWSETLRACRAERVTAAAFLLANYATVLADWADATHFCVNVTLFDRDPAVPGIDAVIGDFTSLLLLECHIDTGLSIWAQARRLQDQLLTDLPHSAADAVWLQRELLRHHGRPAAAVFPVVFTSGLGLASAAAPGGSAADLGTLVYSVSQTPQTVLDFQMWEKAGALALSWDFVAQAIPPAVAQRHLDIMVEAVRAAASPTGRLVAPSAGRSDDELGELTEHVVRVCAAALGQSRVEPGDNFFQLGGDSATATAVVNQLGSIAPATATLRLLFENPVIGEFAGKLRAIDPADATPDGSVMEEGVL